MISLENGKLYEVVSVRVIFVRVGLDLWVISPLLTNKYGRSRKKTQERCEVATYLPSNKTMNNGLNNSEDTCDRTAKWAPELSVGDDLSIEHAALHELSRWSRSLLDLHAHLAARHFSIIHSPHACRLDCRKQTTPKQKINTLQSESSSSSHLSAGSRHLLIP